MQLRTDLALNAVISSLTKVVMPAVDSANGPAREQLQVAIGLLSLLVDRLPLEFDFDRDELGRTIAFAQALVAIAPEDHGRDALIMAVRDAHEVLDRARAAPHHLQRAVRALREASGALVTAVHATADTAHRADLTALVLTHQREQLLRERAWLQPQGWESRPDALPAIAQLLGLDDAPPRT
jgi:hypothetical protein